MNDLNPLTEHLRLARDAELPFVDAWPVAVEALLPTLPRRERAAWDLTLMGTQGYWRRAYDRWPPTRAERQLAQLPALLTAAQG